VVVIVVVVIIAIAYLFLNRKGGQAGIVTSIGSLFGVANNVIGGQNPTPIHAGSSSPTTNTTDGGGVNEPLFRQLANVQVAGATTAQHDGKIFVRYIARETGNVFEVDPQTGQVTQLTNTTIPRIYEAYWGNNGNTVVLRYLTRDTLAQKDVIKTVIANLVLPINYSSSTDTMGSLVTNVTDFLQDNISAVSVSADGTKLFYLLPIPEGVSGTIVTLSTKVAHEVFRNTFSEWLPQLLNNGNVVLTTKPSANIPGFAYLYDATNKTLSRIVREKDGLTTLSTATGARILYGENIAGNTALSMYDAKGFALDQGETTHTAQLQLVTLPEKCAWSHNNVRIYCGAFTSTPHAQIPDDWYQGVLNFSDTFWTVNTDQSDLVFLADPQKEIQQNFDVFMPFVGADENYFFFINKNDATLWSMRLIKDKFTTSDEPALEATTTPLTPAELKDAAGSVPTPVAPKQTTTKKSR
jgi:hypothetical protein